MSKEVVELNLDSAADCCWRRFSESPIMRAGAMLVVRPSLFTFTMIAPLAVRWKFEHPLRVLFRDKKEDALVVLEDSTVDQLYENEAHTLTVVLTFREMRFMELAEERTRKLNLLLDES